MDVHGVDFTSAPSIRKPVVVASGTLVADGLFIERLERLRSLELFEAFLRRPGPWVGGFDVPFGLPRELVIGLGWPRSWPDLVRHFAALPREEIAAMFAAFRASRPMGRKYAHRKGDGRSGAHPSMKLVNPPVAWMFREAAPRLLAAGVHVPGLHAGDPARVALEAYPGLLMRRIAQARGIARAPSYKNDARSKQTATHRDARRFLLAGLCDGCAGVAVVIPALMADEVIDEGSADGLDAIAAAAQAAWGLARAGDNYGLPRDVDPLEGWIVSA